MVHVPYTLRSAEEKARLGAQTPEPDSPFYAEVRFSETHAYMVLCMKQGDLTAEAATISFWGDPDAEYQITKDIAIHAGPPIGAMAPLAAAGFMLDRTDLLVLAQTVMMAGITGSTLAMMAKSYEGEWREPHLDNRYVGVGIPLSAEQFATLVYDAEHLKKNIPAYNPLDSHGVWRNIPNAEHLGGENCVGIVNRLLEASIGMSLHDRLGHGLPGKMYPLVNLLHGHVADMVGKHERGQTPPERNDLKFFVYSNDGKRQAVEAPAVGG